MRHVLDTEGGRALVVELRKNVFRAYKRHLQQPLCASVIEGCPCPDGQQCLHIHVTPEGYADRRLWVDPSHRPRPVSNATVDFLTVTPADRRPLLPPRPPLPPVAQDGGASSDFGAEFRPCGPYLPSPYVTVSLPPPASAHPAPRCHGAVPPFPHDDRAVTQQRISRLRRRVRIDVDRTLAQIRSTGRIYLPLHVLVNSHASQMPAGPQPFGPGPLPVIPSAGPYAPSSPFVHPIPPLITTPSRTPCGSPRRPTWDLGDDASCVRLTAPRCPSNAPPDTALRSGSFPYAGQHS
jgi:hypothetical protein